MQKKFEIEQGVPEIQGFKRLEIILLRETKKKKKIPLCPVWQAYQTQQYAICSLVHTLGLYNGLSLTAEETLPAAEQGYYKTRILASHSYVCTNELDSNSRKTVQTHSLTQGPCGPLRDPKNSTSLQIVSLRVRVVYPNSFTRLKVSGPPYIQILWGPDMMLY